MLGFLTSDHPVYPVVHGQGRVGVQCGQLIRCHTFQVSQLRVDQQFAFRLVDGLQRGGVLQSQADAIFEPFLRAGFDEFDAFFCVKWRFAASGHFSITPFGFNWARSVFRHTLRNTPDVAGCCGI